MQKKNTGKHCCEVLGNGCSSSLCLFFYSQRKRHKNAFYVLFFPNWEEDTVHPRSHHKGATGRVRTGDQRYPVLCHFLRQDIDAFHFCLTSTVPAGGSQLNWIYFSFEFPAAACSSLSKSRAESPRMYVQAILGGIMASVHSKSNWKAAQQNYIDEENHILTH